MPATSNFFRLDCEYVASIKAQYDVNKNQLSPEKVNWEKEAKTLLEFLERYSLPQFTSALKKALNDSPNIE